MRQLLIPREVGPGETVELGNEDSHYLLHVLRGAPGDTVDIVDAAGRALTAELVVGPEGRAAVRIIGDRSTTLPLPGYGGEITIYQAVPKGRRFDDIIRQTVQGGATEIVPLLTARTVVQLRENESSRVDRWQRVAREAVQQSGAGKPVRILPPLPLRELFPPREALSLFLHPQPLEQATLHGYLVGVPKHVALVVGPEGGFTDQETSLMSERGFRPLYLGARVLRTETAAVFALGAVQTVLEERSSWQPAG